MDKFGIPSTMQKGRLIDIKYYVSQNRPIIVLLRSGYQYWHYVVVIGYTETKLTIADPGGYKHDMDNETFLNAWNFYADMQGRPYGMFDIYQTMLQSVDVTGRLMIVIK